MRQIRVAKTRPRPATAADQPRISRPPHPGVLHRVAGCDGGRLPGTARDPEPYRRLDLAAGPACNLSRRYWPATSPTAPELLECRQIPGVGNRHRHAETTGKVLALKQQVPDPVILPAHDPTAAARLLGT